MLLCAIIFNLEGIKTSKHTYIDYCGVETGFIEEKSTLFKLLSDFGIKGVLVVAEGAADSRVKERIAEAVRTFLNLPAYRVIVVEGKFN